MHQKRFFLIILFSTLILPATFAQEQDKNEVLSRIMQSIPSPLEISSLIREQGVTYYPEILNPASNVAKYNDDYKRALNLGIYSTDLGYVNIYEKKDTNAMGYLSSIINISNGLKVEDQIDFTSITKYAYSNDLNGLLAETNNAFENINQKLVNNQTPELSVLILTGGWLETLYLTCQIARKFPNEVLDTRIAEQKIILESLLGTIKQYQKGNKMAELVKQLEGLNDLFKKIRIKQKVKADEGDFTIEKWGNVEVVYYDPTKDNKNSGDIKYDSEDLDNILKASENIRTQIVN